VVVVVDGAVVVVDEVGAVVVVVDGAVVVVVVEQLLDVAVTCVAASTFNFWATSKPAVTMAGVAGPAPRAAMSFWPCVPRAKRMN
jgi:hypothetical protein